MEKKVIKKEVEVEEKVILEKEIELKKETEIKIETPLTTEKVEKIVCKVDKKTGLVSILGTGKSDNMPKGESYDVAPELAKILINKGAAKQK